MKKVFVLLLVVATTVASAQKVRFGIKGGLNYGAPGKIVDIDGGVFDNFDLEDNTGYHAGIFLQAKVLGIGIQPEIVYTSLNSTLEGDNIDGDYKLNKLDIPVLVSFNVLGPLSLKVGPSFQYILSNELESRDLANINLDDPEDSFTLGYQLGAGLQLGQLGLDVRYENAFGENNALVSATGTDFTVDNRPSQWILSLSYRFSGSK